MLILGVETATERVSVAIGGHEGVIGLFEITKGRVTNDWPQASHRNLVGQWQEDNRTRSRIRYQFFGR